MKALRSAHAANSWWPALAAGLLFVVLAGTTMQLMPPSGDGISTWASLEPLRSVLCVQEGQPPGLVLAAQPSGSDRAAVSATLASTETQSHWGPLSVIHRDHSYRALLGLGSWTLPWMKGSYSAGFPDWVPHLAFRATGQFAAGRLVTLLFGLVTLIAACLLAGRFGGWQAAAVTGVLLGTDLTFHVYKKLLAGTEVWLQALAIAAIAAMLAALRHRSGRWLAVAGLLSGLGMHVKPSFAALAVTLAIVSLPWLPWARLRRRKGWKDTLRAAALTALLTAVGFGPSVLYWTLLPAQATQSVGGQESTGGRIPQILDNLLGRQAPKGPGASDSQSAPNQGRDLKKEVRPTQLAVDPLAFWVQQFDRKAVFGNHPSPPAKVSPYHRGVLAQAGTLAMALLVFAAVAGALRRRKDSDPMLLLPWLGLIVVLLPIVLQRVQADAHHLSIWVPLLWIFVGAGVGALLQSTSRRRVAGMVVAAALLFAGSGRISELSRMDTELENRVGRLLDQRSIEVLADTLEKLGATAPAVLEYEMMALLEGHSGGRIRPFLYARAAAGTAGECLRSDDPAWLVSLLEAHRGGHLVVTWGPSTYFMNSSFIEADTVRLAATMAGVTLRPPHRLWDSRQRWFATIWTIDR